MCLYFYRIGEDNNIWKRIIRIGEDYEDYGDYEGKYGDYEKEDSENSEEYYKEEGCEKEDYDTENKRGNRIYSNTSGAF